MPRTLAGLQKLTGRANRMQGGGSSRPRTLSQQNGAAMGRAAKVVGKATARPVWTDADPALSRRVSADTPLHPTSGN